MPRKPRNRHFADFIPKSFNQAGSSTAWVDKQSMPDKQEALLMLRQNSLTQGYQQKCHSTTIL